MSQENVEKLRAFWTAWSFEEPDISLLESMLDPEVIYEDANLPDHLGERYHGLEGVVQATGRWLEAYEWLKLELERIVGDGDRLVSIHRARTKGRASGIEDEAPIAYAWTFQNGRVVHFRSYRDPAEALKAAGLRE